MSDTITNPPPAPPAPPPGKLLNPKNLFPKKAADNILPPKPLYAMPKACVGMGVLWFPYGETDNPGMPAKVNAVGERTLSLHIFLPQRVNMMYKDGVRHCTDPEAKREEYIDAGSWDYDEQTKAMFQIQADLESMRAAVEMR